MILVIFGSPFGTTKRASGPRAAAAAERPSKIKTNKIEKEEEEVPKKIPEQLSGLEFPEFQLWAPKY